MTTTRHRDPAVQALIDLAATDPFTAELAAAEIAAEARAIDAEEARAQGAYLGAAARDDFAGRFEDTDAVRRFIEAGNATLTLVSGRSGARFTFKFTRPPAEPGRDRPIWVKLLSGADNEGDYEFMGTVWIAAANGMSYSYRSSAKVRVSPAAPSMKALMWFLKKLNLSDAALFAQAEVWHEGRCGRCGRKLTVPSSIANGFGPECAGKI